MRFLTLLTGAAVFCMVSSNANACDICDHSEKGEAHSHKVSTADDHAPIGVMGDHNHKAGDIMLSYRYMHMNMDGLRNGTSDLNPDTLATSSPNRFAGMAGQPATLRVIPTEMQMDMHMLGAMYAPTDRVTLMIMGNYLEKEMTSITYAGGAGTNRLGENTVKSQGWGDTTVSALWEVYEDDMNTVLFNTGLSIPTGSIKESDEMLMPNGTRMNMRLGYGMQLGTGTYDFMPGVTYYGHKGDWGWGAQYMAQIALEDENDQGYSWGDKHQLTAWGSYEWAPWISTSLRLTGISQGDIDGIDSNIMGPNPVADPDNFGGETLEAGFGVNLMAMEGVLKGQRVAFEVTAPLYQDLNGPQMKRDYAVTIGWQYAF